MPDLTREQVEALARCRESAAYYPVILDTRSYRVTAETVRALATEVLALRDRRCGSCRHHDTSHVDISGRLSCLRLGRLVAADWHCADWTAKEGA